MKANSIRRLRSITPLLVLPFLFAAPMGASADPGKSEHQSADTSNLGDAKTGTGWLSWHWQSEPAAYRPDGLSDYSEDFSAHGREKAARELGTATDHADAFAQYENVTSE